MKRLLLVGAVTAAIVALVWTCPAGLVRAAGPQQPAAKQAQDKKATEKQATDKKAADKKAADQKATQAKPAQPPAPSVPPDYRALMEASTIADPAKRSEAVRKAIMDLYTKQMPEAPDRKAFNDALKQTDPAKKVEALQKFLKDFPTSGGVSSANAELLVALIADGKKKVLDHANAMIEAVPESSSSLAAMSRAAIYNTVADRLMVGELLLDEAEKFANKSISLYDEQKYIESQRKIYETMTAAMAKTNPERKTPPVPSDAELRERFLARKAVSETTLAEIYMKKGRTADAEKLLKQIHAAVPTKANVSGYLADLAKKAGREAEMMEYLTALATAGPLAPERRKDFEAGWRKAHNGTLDGLDAMLDVAYEKNNPKPTVTPYVAPKTRTDRVVLAEIFTGSGCPPCVGADLAFEGALHRYKGRELAVLMYHLHIPQPDPMTNPSTQARSKFYNVNGVPSFYIDGETDGRGGGGASAAPTIYKDRVEPVIDKCLTTKADAKLTLQATMTGSAINVKVDVGKPKAAGKNLKLQVALVEERVRYTGENGVRFHSMVVRSLAGKDALGFSMEAGKRLKVAWTFDVPKIVAEAKAHLDDFEAKRSTGGPTKFEFAEKKHDIDPKKLVVVAFVQDGDTKKVLQAAYFKVRPAGATTDEN
jgi:tetratricopeptide (TPR) repeat protein